MLLMFEDDLWRNFVPLSYTRPLFDMRCGAFTLRERIAAMLATGLAELVSSAQPVVQGGVGQRGRSLLLLLPMCAGYSSLRGCAGPI